MTKLSILHVCKKYPPALGGDTVVVSHLEREQKKNGHRVIIVTSRLKDLARRSGLYGIGLPETGAGLDAITPRRLLSLLILGVKMFAILRRERPNVIHTHSVDMAFFVSFAARWYHIPLVHTFHIVTFYDSRQSWLRRHSELWLARGAGAYRLTAPNSYDVAQLQAAGLRRTVLLPNGVDLDYWQVTPQKSPVFSFVAFGRLESQKGYEYLIKAAALLKDHDPFTVTMIGEGTRLGALKKLAHTLDVTDIVTFVGRKSAAETRTLLASADAVVQPSLYETTPLTLLEAWAAGKPVITTPVGILRDTDRAFRAAHVVPLRDEYALMEAMHHLMNNAEERRLIAQNAKQEVKQYNWPTIARTTETIYQGAR